MQRAFTYLKNLPRVETSPPDISAKSGGLVSLQAVRRDPLGGSLIAGGKEGPMKITLNPDEEMVKAIKEGLERTGGYCPCRFQKTEENKCMCKEFRDQIKDPSFEGFCYCRLYYKYK